MNPEFGSAIAAALGEMDVWVVGGTVRDELLDRETGDIDLAIGGDPEQAARRVARALKAPVFELSATFGTWRVIAEGMQVDCSVLQGETIEQDLARRDFSVNAIARSLPGGALIDPHGGERDVANRTLRMVSEQNLVDDPLRILRLVRLAVELGFSVDDPTRAASRRQAPLLESVAGERVFAELKRVIGAADVRGGLSLLDELGTMGIVLPEVASLRGVEQNRYHHLDVYEHTLLVLDQVLKLQSDPGLLLPGLGEENAARVEALLAEPLADELTRGDALRFGALLHDVAKPQTQARSDDGTVLGFPDHAAQGSDQVRAICDRWRTSDRLRSHLVQLTRHHLGLGFLVHEEGLDARVIYRYLRRTAPAHVDVSLLSIADRLATGGYKAEVSTERHLEVARRVLPAALDFDAATARAPLIRGDELARELGLDPGPRLGEILASVEEARYAGEITTADEAVQYARSL